MIIMREKHDTNLVFWPVNATIMNNRLEFLKYMLVRMKDE
jgi:hypothetical protein